MVGVPAPGPVSNFGRVCVACLRTTDTGIGFRGRPSWIVASLSTLGLEAERAADVVARASGHDPGALPEGTVSVVLQVCRDCARPSLRSLPPPGVLTNGLGFVPWVRQPTDDGCSATAT